MDFAERCAELHAGFRATGPLRRMRKSELLPGEIDGAPAIAKRMMKPSSVWDWYFAHEVAVYRAFVASPPPFPVPSVFAIADDVIIMERFPSSLATLRRPYADVSPTALVAQHAAIATYAFPTVPASPSKVLHEVSRRLLEDPTNPSWIVDGLERCRGRDLIDGDVYRAAIIALSDAPISPSHGDLLLRNAMQRDDGTVVLVDWECAGEHLADWDLALLWTQLAPEGRAIVEAGIADPVAFGALVVFALCRELVFLDAFRTAREHAGRRRVEAELAAARALLLRP